MNCLKCGGEELVYIEVYQETRNSPIEETGFIDYFSTETVREDQVEHYVECKDCGCHFAPEIEIVEQGNKTSGEIIRSLSLWKGSKR